MSAWMMGALLLVLFAWIRRRSPRAMATTSPRLHIDTNGLEYAYADCTRRAEWKDVTEVRIQTTDEGPLLEDVFFAVHTDSGSMPQVIVPHDDAVRGKLLEELQRRLPGLDNTAVLEAMGCCQRRTFVIWRRHDGATDSRSG